MNKYTYSFFSTCPNNGEIISYELSITHDKTIMVEHIKSSAKTMEGRFHEDIADLMYREFGGLQVIRATHHGVQIETTRGGE